VIRTQRSEMLHGGDCAMRDAPPGAALSVSWTN
jgi:hypothetical protein